VQPAPVQNLVKFKNLRQWKTLSSAKITVSLRPYYTVEKLPSQEQVFGLAKAQSLVYNIYID